MYTLTSFTHLITDLGHVKENGNLTVRVVLLFVKRTCKESKWGMRFTLTLTFEADWHLLRWPNLNVRCSVALNAHDVSIKFIQCLVSLKSRREFQPRSGVCVYFYIYMCVWICVYACMNICVCIWASSSSLLELSVWTLCRGTEAWREFAPWL